MHNQKKEDTKEKSTEYHQKQQTKTPMEAQNYQEKKDKMAIENPHTSIITLNINGLNS